MTTRAAAVIRTMRIKSEFPSAIPAAEYDRYHFYVQNRIFSRCSLGQMMKIML